MSEQKKDKRHLTTGLGAAGIATGGTLAGASMAGHKAATLTNRGVHNATVAAHHDAYAKTKATKEALTDHVRNSAKYVKRHPIKTRLGSRNMPAMPEVKVTAAHRAGFDPSRVKSVVPYQAKHFKALKGAAIGGGALAAGSAIGLGARHIKHKKQQVSKGYQPLDYRVNRIAARSHDPRPEITSLVGGNKGRAYNKGFYAPGQSNATRGTDRRRYNTRTVAAPLLGAAAGVGAAKAIQSRSSKKGKEPTRASKNAARGAAIAGTGLGAYSAVDHGNWMKGSVQQHATKFGSLKGYKTNICPSGAPVAAIASGLVAGGVATRISQKKRQQVSKNDSRESAKKLSIAAVGGAAGGATGVAVRRKLHEGQIIRPKVTPSQSANIARSMQYDKLAHTTKGIAAAKAPTLTTAEVALKGKMQGLSGQHGILGTAKAAGGAMAPALAIAGGTLGARYLYNKKKQQKQGSDLVTKMFQPLDYTYNRIATGNRVKEKVTSFKPLGGYADSMDKVDRARYIPRMVGAPVLGAATGAAIASRSQKSSKKKAAVLGGTGAALTGTSLGIHMTGERKFKAAYAAKHGAAKTASTYKRSICPSGAMGIAAGTGLMAAGAVHARKNKKDTVSKKSEFTSGLKRGAGAFVGGAAALAGTQYAVKRIRARSKNQKVLQQVDRIEDMVSKQQPDRGKGYKKSVLRGAAIGGGAGIAVGGATVGAATAKGRRVGLNLIDGLSNTALGNMQRLGASPTQTAAARAKFATGRAEAARNLNRMVASRTALGAAGVGLAGAGVGAGVGAIHRASKNKKLQKVETVNKAVAIPYHGSNFKSFGTALRDIPSMATLKRQSANRMIKPSFMKQVVKPALKDARTKAGRTDLKNTLSRKSGGFGLSAEYLANNS